MFWVHLHQSMSSYSQPPFQFHLEERWGMDGQTKLGVSKTVENNLS